MQNLSLPDIYTAIVNNVWLDESGELQATMLKEFSKSYRICDYNSLIKYKAFLVYYNNLLLDYTPEKANPEGLYSLNGVCFFKNRLVIPIWGFDKKVHGFVGYDNGNECSTKQEKDSLIPYLYLSDKYFQKDKFWFLTYDEYISAFNNQYICIVDGIFDKITLQSLGYNTTSLLGSNLTTYHRDYLRYIKNWIVFSDSDVAGNHLYEICKRYNPNTIRIQVGNAKDIDERLRNDTNSKLILHNLFNDLKIEHYFFNHSIEEYAI